MCVYVCTLSCYLIDNNTFISDHILHQKSLGHGVLLFQKNIFGSFPHKLNAIWYGYELSAFFIPVTLRGNTWCSGLLNQPSCSILTVFKDRNDKLTNKTYSHLTPDFTAILLLYIWLSGNFVSFSAIRRGK